MFAASRIISYIKLGITLQRVQRFNVFNALHLVLSVLSFIYLKTLSNHHVSRDLIKPCIRASWFISDVLNDGTNSFLWCLMPGARHTVLLFDEEHCCLLLKSTM